MKLEARTVVYRRLLTIDHVPVFHCKACAYCEINSLIKEQLVQLVEQAHTYATSKGEKKTIDFSEHNEIAAMLHNGLTSSESLQCMFEQRVDELLDLLLLARSLQRSEWIEEMELRLSQLARMAASV